MTPGNAIHCVLGLAVGGLVLLVPPGVARGWCQSDELTKLTASGAAERDWFGLSVSVSGDAALISAHKDDEYGEDSGAAYVYRFEDGAWIEEANPGLPHHDDTQLRVRNAAGNNMRALLRFNLGPLPAGSQINSATAWFHWSGTVTAGGS